MIKTLVVVSVFASACGPSTKPAPVISNQPESEPVAEADELCDALAKVIADTPNDYANLRGAAREADPDSPTWEGTIVLSEGMTSEVSLRLGSGQWTTSWEDDGEGADQLLALERRISSCRVMAGFTLLPFEPAGDEYHDGDVRTTFTWEANDASDTAVHLEYVDPGVTLTVWRENIRL